MRALFWKFTLCLSAATFLATTLAFSKPQHAPALAPPVIPTPAEYVRTPDQTFLTYPEWYLVYSPAEYATYLSGHRPPSDFPFFGQIGQFWQSYAAVAREIRKYPFNGGYHLMVMVIGLSTTVEYTIRGIYEATVGRIFEALTVGSQPVPEEIFAAKYAQEYVDFIRVDPWYKFNFWAQLKSLWTDYPLGFKNLPRRLERRFALTTELLVKTGYAWLIKLGSQSVYDPPKPVTAVTLTKEPVADRMMPDLKILTADQAMGQVLVTIPRYQAFTTYSVALAAQGENFTSIAGNTGEVMVSFIGTKGKGAVDGRLLFRQPIITQPGRERWVVVVPINKLGSVLRASVRDHVDVEHIYDF